MIGSEDDIQSNQAFDETLIIVSIYISVVLFFIKILKRFIYFQENLNKLKVLLLIFMKKVNRAIKNSYGPYHLHIMFVYNPSGTLIFSLRRCKKKDQSENDETTPVLSIIELDPTECNSMSMDTDTEPECEIITKPEEAGGTISKLIILYKNI